MLDRLARLLTRKEWILLLVRKKRQHQTAKSSLLRINHICAVPQANFPGVNPLSK